MRKPSGVASAILAGRDPEGTLLGQNGPLGTIGPQRAVGEHAHQETFLPASLPPL